MRSKKDSIKLSATFSYKICKEIDGIQGGGSTAWWASRAHKLFGSAPQSLVPDTGRTDEEMLATYIPVHALEVARHCRTLYYQRLYTLADFAYALNKRSGEPSPCSIEFDIFESIKSAPRGEVPLPQIGERQMGSHCVGAHRYIKKEDGKEYFLFANSWGSKWGDKGYGYLPVSYLEHELINSGWAFEIFVEPAEIVQMKTHYLDMQDGNRFRVESAWYPPLRSSRYRIAIFDIYLGDDLIVGCFHASPSDEKTIEIEEMYILPRFQGIGIGTAVLEFVESIVRSYGFTKVIGWIGAQDVIEGRRSKLLRFLENAKYKVIKDNTRFKDAVYKFEKTI